MKGRRWWDGCGRVVASWRWVPAPFQHGHVQKLEKLEPCGHEQPPGFNHGHNLNRICMPCVRLQEEGKPFPHQGKVAQ